MTRTSHLSTELSTYTSSKTFVLKTIEDKLYVTAESGVYVLESNKWKQILNVDGAMFYSIDIDKNNNRLWTLADKGVYSSNDFGISWNTVNITNDSEIYSYLFVSKSGDIYVGTSDNLYKSSDNVNEWTKIFNLGFIPGLCCSVMTEDTEGNLYVALSDLNVYIKKINQNAFKRIDSVRPNPSTNTFLYFNNMFLYEEVPGQLIISDIMGNIISTIQSNSTFILGDGFWDIRQMYPLVNENKILITHDNGVSELDLLTKNIKKYSPLPKYSEITSLTIFGSKNSLATTYWDHESLITDDCGSSWKRSFGWEGDYLYGDMKSNAYIKQDSTTLGLIYDNLFLGGIDCLPSAFTVALDSTSSPTRAYSVCIEKDENKLLSLDIVTNFSKINLIKADLPTIYVSGLTIDTTNPNRLLVAGNEKENETQRKGQSILGVKGVYESLDKGQNWNRIIKRPEGGFGGSIVINPFDSSEILISGHDGNIFFIKNGLIKEMNVSSSNSKARGYIHSLAYDNKKPNVIYVGASNGFYSSKDKGQTWQEFNKGLYSKDIRKIITKDDKIFIGTWGSGIAVILKQKLLK